MVDYFTGNKIFLNLGVFTGLNLLVVVAIFSHHANYFVIILLPQVAQLKK
jgi:hypothetical protein